MILPEHMTVWDRNQRLYETLKGMGLHTEVVLCRDDPTKIDQIVVAAAPPTVTLLTAEQAAQLRVDLPAQGPKIGEVVGPTEREGGNVVDFPPVL